MLEIFSIHLFLIFNVLLEMYNCWLLQIAQLENVKGQLPIEGAPAVWSGEEWIYVQPFIDLKKSDTAVEETVDKSNEYFKPSVLNKEHDDFFAGMYNATMTLETYPLQGGSFNNTRIIYIKGIGSIMQNGIVP